MQALRHDALRRQAGMEVGYLPLNLSGDYGLTSRPLRTRPPPPPNTLPPRSSLYVNGARRPQQHLPMEGRV